MSPALAAETRASAKAATCMSVFWLWAASKPAKRVALFWDGGISQRKPTGGGPMGFPL
jgi:hypothetical protein